MKISINGYLGSGKSTIGKLLSAQLNIKLFSTGSIQRKIAKELNINTLELNLISESEVKIDEKIDAFLVDLDNSSDSMIVDSRLAWHFIHNSFNIFLYVDINVAAERIVKDVNRQSEKYDNIKDAKERLIQRRQSENRRFVKLYNVDCSDFENYDCIIDTSYATPEVIAKLIIDCYYRWLQKEHYNKCWFSPANLFPTHGATALSGDGAPCLFSIINSNGYDEGQPVEVLKNEKFYYIYDGHRRVSAAILAGLNLIPIRIIANYADEIRPGLTVAAYVKNESSSSLIHNWEDCHKFQFKEYP